MALTCVPPTSSQWPNTNVFTPAARHAQSATSSADGRFASVNTSWTSRLLLLLVERPASLPREKPPGRAGHRARERLDHPMHQHVVIIVAVDVVAERVRVPFPPGRMRRRRR